MSRLPESQTTSKDILTGIDFSSGNTYPIPQDYQVVSFSDLLEQKALKQEKWNQQQLIREQILPEKQQLGKVNNKIIDKNQLKAREYKKNNYMSEAIMFLLKALKNYKEYYGKNSKKVISTYYKIGSYYIEKEELKQSEKNLKKCHKMICDLGEQQSLGGIKVCTKIGAIKLSSDKNLALSYFLRCQKLCRQIELGYTCYHSVSYNALGVAYRDLKDFKWALFCIWKSLLMRIMFIRKSPNGFQTVKEDGWENLWNLMGNFYYTIIQNPENQQKLIGIEREIQRLTLKTLKDRFKLKIVDSSNDSELQNVQLQQKYLLENKKQSCLNLKDKTSIAQNLQNIAECKMRMNRIPQGLNLLKIIKRYIQSEKDLIESHRYRLIMKKCQKLEDEGFDLQI